MINRKHIVIAAFIAILSTACNSVTAENSNSLLQMDVKRSSVADTVDVTFYTTGEMGNSVVTRKANNRYVVLLPNVSSSSSVAPGFGGVKDLVTDIDVKHVDDGIGGYTKVTFGTTKPINIKTHMQKTSPLTQAQKDYKAILANNAKNATTAQAKPAAQTKTTTPAPATQNKTANKPTQTAATKPAVAPKTQQKQQVPAKSLVSAITPKNPSKTTAQTTKQAPVEPQEIDTTTAAYVPKMKFDENGKRMIDLEPRVSHTVQTDTSQKLIEDAPIEDTSNEEIATEAETPIAVEAPDAQQNKSHLPFWILLGGTSVILAGIVYLILDAKLHATHKDEKRLHSFFKMSSQNVAKRRKQEYNDIVNNEELSWQEKYKLYNEKEEQRKVKKAPLQMSYITDMSGVKKAVLVQADTVPESTEKQTGRTEIKQIKSTPSVKNEFKAKFSDNMQAKISQMEHALAQTSKEPEEVSDKVKSEDEAITNKIAEIKLKTFSKPVSLKETHRTLAETDNNKSSRNKSYKEGRFVKLKNSPLSVNKRNSSSEKLEVNDLIKTGDKYITKNNGEIKMSKEKENYLLSSLDEYLSILDVETEKKSTTVGSLSQLKSPASQAMTRSGVTNPISKASQPSGPIPYMNALVVKSGYNIDSEKGFYVVNIDGVSALVGRVKDNVFILKKFDHVVDKPIQVRQDDGSVYIVRVGKFKCLVDVSKEKMGTLIEI